jgi:hypothetical protein
MLQEKEEKSLEASMLERLMSLLPNHKTKCSTAQRKAIQHHSHDLAKICWCCWVTDDEGDKFFAMYDGENDVKLITEKAKQSYIVKPAK